MNKYFLLSLCLAICVCGQIQAQDEQLNVMTYNILNFPSSSATNNDERAGAFGAIIDEVAPDAILVQELRSHAGAFMLLDSINNNPSGIVYAKAPFYFSYGGLGNMLFYNATKMGFLSQTEIPVNNIDLVGGFDNATPRQPSHYRLYMKDPNLGVHLDTTYIDLISVHLKAGDNNASGNQIADEDRRLNGTQDILDYIATMPSDHNIVIGGDFNFYDDDFPNDTDGNGYTEAAYGELVNNGMFDPYGSWVRDSNVDVDVFSQSTRSSTTSATLTATNGGAIGGLDDRFDLIFYEAAIDIGSNDVIYDIGSYEVYGTVSSLNQSVLSGSSTIKDELHTMSDHYPVIANFNVFYPLACAPSPIIDAVDIVCLGGTNSGSIEITASTPSGNNLLYSLDGINFQTSNVFGNLPDGNYFVYVKDVITDCTRQSIRAYSIDCADVCAISQLTTNLVCTGMNDEYTLIVDFYAINLSGNSIEVEIDGTTYGPYPLTGSGPSYSLAIPSSDFTGNASNNQSNVMVNVFDATAVAATGNIVINEVLANASGGSSVSDNGSGEFIELYCVGPGQCDIGCYIVGDDDYAYLIPSGTVLDAGDYYVLHGENLNLNGGPLPVGTAFFNWDDAGNSGNITDLSGGSGTGGLTNSAEQVYIWDDNGNVVDGIIWGGGSSNLNNSYLISATSACGGGNLNLTQASNVNTISNSGTADGRPIVLNNSGVWVNSNPLPSPGNANPSQLPVDGAASCIASTTYDESTLQNCITGSDLNLNLTVLLEGPFETASNLMRTELNTQGLLPNTQPYNIAPYNYTGIETVSIFPSNVVDWVLIEIRDGQNNSDLVDRKAGLLLNNGRVTDEDGVSNLIFSNLDINRSYYFVVRHRNHLDVMSSTATPFTNFYTYDFTDATSKAFFGSSPNQLKMVGTKSVMLAGEINQDLSIQTTDRDEWRSLPAVLHIYHEADTNMDGVIQTTDYDTWYPNRSILSPPQLDY